VDKPIGERVAANITATRARRQLSQQAVVEKLAELGVPMLKTTLSKIENAGRGVDVDELVALALALDVTPNRLLLPDRADGEEIDLAPNETSTSSEAWTWATYRRPLDATAVLRHWTANLELFDSLNRALHALREAGVPLEVIETYVGFLDHFETMAAEEAEVEHNKRRGGESDG
jgi:transcriptional regulator with XRE-family HTH domain